MIEALTLTPPWDGLIIHAGKNPENRKWKTTKRGWVLIHASAAMTRDDYDGAVSFAEVAGYQGPIPAFGDIRRGVITGAVKIVDCLHHDEQVRRGMDTRWAMRGQYGFMLASPIALPLVPAKGALSFWKVPRDVREKILAECVRASVVLPADLAKMLGEHDEGEPAKKQGAFDF